MKKILRLFLAVFILSTSFVSPSFADLERSFSDLTRCINTKKALDVYYLIDESGSLKRTDPTDERANILATSLRTLGGFKDDVSINYAVGFFGDDLRPWKNWTKVNPSTLDTESKQLAAQIRASNGDNDTNWLAGINGAKKKLQEQRSVSDACQALIWLTDGGIWIGQQEPNQKQIDQLATDRAVEELCSNVFQSLRQANVSVFGVLLKNDQAINKVKEPDRSQTLAGMEYMRSLVEGKGTLNDENLGNRRCGTVPVPPNYSAGGLLIAQDPVGLALKFLELTTIIEGGSPGDISAGDPADFEIEPGVRKFRILTTAKKWTLTSPDGQSFSNTQPAGIAQQTSGVNQLTVDVKSSQIGKWKFKNDGTINKLLLFSGLAIDLQPTQLVAGAKGRISGAISSENGEPVDLNVYGSTKLTVEEVLGSGRSTDLGLPTLNSSGSFELSEFTPSPNQSSLEIRVTFRATTKKGVELAPVSISTSLTVNLPADYPTVMNSPIRLSNLVGNGEAKGIVELSGPQSGIGKVCFEKSTNNGISILSDSVDRSNSYKWTLDTAALDPSGCLALAQQEKKAIAISVKNSTGADSEVTAEIPLTFKSDKPGKSDFKLSAPIEFTSEIKRVGGTWIKAFLFLVGIGLPLLFSYLLTWATTKIAIGNRIQRAEYPVAVNATRGIVASDGSALSAPVATDFRNLPEQVDTRKYQDQVGTMRAKVSKLVFRDPWFEVAASAGTRVLTFPKVAPGRGKSAAKLRKRFTAGDIAPMGGNLADFWALSIKEPDLLSGKASGTVPARLVVFKRNDIKDTNQHIKRMTEILATPGVWTAISMLPTQSKSKVKEKAEKSEKSARVESEILPQSPSASLSPEKVEQENTPPASPPAAPPPPPPPPPPMRG